MEIRNSCSVAESQEGWLCNIDSLISKLETQLVVYVVRSATTDLADYSLAHLAYCSLLRQSVALMFQDGFQLLCFTITSLKMPHTRAAGQGWLYLTEHPY
jgi:hypothetical protein